MQEENTQQNTDTEQTDVEKKPDTQVKPESPKTGGVSTSTNDRDNDRGQSRDRRKSGIGGPGGGHGRGKRGPRTEVPAEADYEEKNLEIARVTRVTKGGKRMRFRALMVIGNRKGRVGFGLAKSMDVADATSKATAQARKALLSVPIHNETIPHEVHAKFGGARVLLKPAPAGTGIKAGGAVRAALELAGIPNVVSKILGSNNKSNNVKATFEALKQLQLPKATKKSIEVGGDADKGMAAQKKSVKTEAAKAV